MTNYFYPSGKRRFEIRYDEPQAGHCLLVYDHLERDYIRKTNGAVENFTRQSAKSRIDYMLRNAPLPSAAMTQTR